MVPALTVFLGYGDDYRLGVPRTMIQPGLIIQTFTFRGNAASVPANIPQV